MKKKVIVLFFALCFAFSADAGLQAKAQSETPPITNNSKIDKASDKKLPEYNSEIEKLFAGRLPQFGYEIFDKGGAALLNPKVPEDYRLNVGDNVNVYFWGDTIDVMAITGNNVIKPENQAAVDKEGNLFLPGVGLIKAKGSTVKNVEQQIQGALSSKFAGFKVKVTVSQPGYFPVMVMGNVKQPGVVFLSDTSNFLDALNAGGGVTKEGSLRNIEITNKISKAKINVDLYELILKGNYKNVKISEGDVILVKPVGKVAALSKGVKKPAIYEFKSGETLKDVIKFAGGLLPSVDSKSVQIESFNYTTNQKDIQDLSFEKLGAYVPKDGDYIDFKSIFPSIENFVTISGNIKHPGKFEYKAGMKLSNILKSPNDLLVQTYTSQGIIIRVTGLNKEYKTIPVSLSDFFAKKINPELKPQDNVQIFEATKMPNVLVAGMVSNPGPVIYKNNMDLMDVLSLVKLQDNPDNIVAEISNPSDALRFNAVYLYDILTKAKEDIDISLIAGDRILFRPLTDTEVLQTVKILGYVQKPGVLKLKPGTKLKEAIGLAGGLNDDAFFRGMKFYRPSIGLKQKRDLMELSINARLEMASKISEMQSKEGLDSQNKDKLKEYIDMQNQIASIMEQKAKENMGRIIFNILSNDIGGLAEKDNLELKDGDIIIIPQRPQHVNVLGEVYNQSAITYSKGKSVKYYLNEVGGLTKMADKRGIYLIKANNSSINVKNARLLKPEEGDSIIVMKSIKTPVNWGDVFKNIMQTAFNASSTIFMITKL